MIRINFTRLVMLVGILLVSVNVRAQEFPIAVGVDTTFSGGAVYGGSNGIVAIQGDNNSSNSINAQLVDAGGELIGSRISIGAEGFFPGAIPIFDGTNYFLVWCGFDYILKGQLVSTSGNLIGSPFNIANNISSERPSLFDLAFGENTTLVIFIKTDGHVYGQIVDKSGNLVGNQIPISSNLARESSIAFDGTNFLVTWVENVNDKDIYGQFVSKSGSLVGSNFIIDNGPYFSDNPTSLAYDGTRYLLAFHETPNSQGENPKWTIVGKFITTSGTVEESFTIVDSSAQPFLPKVAFDGNNYFITWTQFTNYSLMGRFFNTSGTPLNEPEVLLAPSTDHKVPIGGVGFGGGLYLVVGTKVDSNFSDGDIYGTFVNPVTEVESQNNQIPDKYELFQNYPNPFNPSTTIKYSIKESGFVQLKVYDVLGKEIETLVNEERRQGNYSVKFNSNNLPSGVYFYTLRVNNFVQSRKMILLR